MVELLAHMGLSIRLSFGIDWWCEMTDPTPTPPIPNTHLQVGMRHFHLLKNRTYTKAVNVEKLWSLLGEEAYAQAKASKDKAPVLDVTKLVRYGFGLMVCGFGQRGWVWTWG